MSKPTTLKQVIQAMQDLIKKELGAEVEVNFAKDQINVYTEQVSYKDAIIDFFTKAGKQLLEVDEMEEEDGFPPAVTVSFSF